MKPFLKCKQKITADLLFTTAAFFLIDLHFFSFSAPEYFDPTTIARHLGDNWALKSSNLRKLLRNLENYYHNELKKDADFSAVNAQKMARQGDPDSIAVAAELVAAAAVTCSEKNTYVQRIMKMSPDSQLAMKEVIQQSIARLRNYEVEDNESEEEDEDNEMVFGGDNLVDIVPPEQDDKRLFGNNYDLERQLEAARRELAHQKAQATEAAEESGKAQIRLQTLVDDLQDRLMKRQDELINAEEELQQATSELEDIKSKFAEVMEQKAVLEDDLDVAKAKAQQLYKAEATVAAYKKKLDDVGVKTQQMEDLEGQAEKYLQQIMELESEVKKSAALQKTVTAMEHKIAKLEKEKVETASSTQNSAQEVSDLKSRLASAESAKKMYEDELSELRAKQVGLEEATTAMENMSINESKEKAVKLEVENKQLRAELEKLKAASVSPAEVSESKNVAGDTGSTPIAFAVPAADDSPEMAALKNEVQRLTDLLAAKEKENAKISGDKDKLEAYTKRTLAKFQDKYLVALQECKAKLKEKQDKIEMLEKRSLSERSAQKREERLLSSTIYELGLGIMQKKLKGGM